MTNPDQFVNGEDKDAEEPAVSESFLPETPEDGWILFIFYLFILIVSKLNCFTPVI